MSHHIDRILAWRETHFVCPVCDKRTREAEANHRKRGSDHRQNEHWLWTCKHCGATHTEGNERLKKP